MITSYALTENKPQKQQDLEAAHWIDVQNPTEAELALIHEKFGIPPEFMRAPMDINERPRIEDIDQCILLLVRCPQEEAAIEALPLAVRPLALILTPTRLITVSYHENMVCDIFEARHFPDQARTHICIALHLLLRISTAFIRSLQAMDAWVGTIEQKLYHSTRNQELLTLMHVEKSLIYVLTALKGNEAVMEKLPSFSELHLNRGEKRLLESVFIENRQATEMAEVFNQVLGSLGDAFGAIVSNNLNKIMKLLTGVTIILMIPTLVVGAYGMNVALPFAQTTGAFLGILLFCLAVCLLMWLWFRRREWI